MKILSLTFASLTGLSAFAAAQSLNVDIGAAGTTPAATFGAAAAQPGTWNDRSAGAAGPTALLNLTGGATAATLTVTTTGFDFLFNNAGTAGDDQNLMDDCQDIGGAGASTTWTFNNLTAGNYTVYTYAWAPDSATFITNVSVNGSPVSPCGGVWVPGYAAGITHVVTPVSGILAAGSITIVCTTSAGFGSLNGFQLRKDPPVTPFTSSCPGDGTGTACPCGNNGLPGNGCANSFVPTGSTLSAAGSASIGSDTMVLTGAGMPPTSTVLYFQATTNTPPGGLAGDGINCLSGNQVRLGTKQNAGGTSSYPGGGDQMISIKGANSAGQLRHYSARYRDHTTLFCAPELFNQTPVVSVTWVP